MNFERSSVGCTDVLSSMFCKNNVDELHFFIKGRGEDSFIAQCISLENGIRKVIADKEFEIGSVTFIRLFVSDYSNQNTEIDTLYQELQEAFCGCSISVIQQPCLEESKVGAWVYAVNIGNGQDRKKEIVDNNLVDQRSGYKHIWTTSMKSGRSGSDKETESIFAEYESYLASHEMNTKANCVRTWLFVKDIDFNYQGVVEARKNFFDGCDMTEETHYLASTGIEGRIGDPSVNVIMDAYSIDGIRHGQVKHLHALENLNPTHEYGVTFERGTSVDFGDRRHIYISGTASINARGIVVHPKDVLKQIDRAMENVVALLSDAEAEETDIAQMLVYLRDVNDSKVIQEYFSNKYAEIPKIIVLAPVCRPGWLIEVECIAIKDISNEVYANF